MGFYFSVGDAGEDAKPLGAIQDRIDNAYRAKYASSPYLSPMIGTQARSATVKVTPRDTNVGKESA